MLPRQRRPPKRIDDGSSPHSFRDSNLFKKDYYEALDITIHELKHQFDQSRGMLTASAIEKVLQPLQMVPFKEFQMSLNSMRRIYRWID